MALKSRKTSSEGVLHKGYKTPKLQVSMEKTANVDLQVHPFLFFGRTRVSDIAKVMHDKDLYAVAVGELNSDIYPELKRQSLEIPYSTVDEVGITFPDEESGKFRHIFRFTEYDTKEGFQILTLGYHLNGTDSRMEIRRIIDSAFEHDVPVYLDHATTSTDTLRDIPKDKEQEVKDLCREYGGRLKMDFNGTNHPLIRRLIKLALNASGAHIREHDTNRSIERIAGELSRDYGIDVPIVAYTDLHARVPGLLKQMGTAGIRIDESKIKHYMPKMVLSSIDDLITSGEYENVNRYLPLSHDFKAYGVPFIMNKLSGGALFPRPRS